VGQVGPFPPSSCWLVSADLVCSAGGWKWPITSLTAVQHHTRFWVTPAMEGGAAGLVPMLPRRLRAWSTLYPAVLRGALRSRHRENRLAQALMPPFLRMNRSKGSERDLYATAYRINRDHLLRVRLSALAGSAHEITFFCDPVKY
jgi:hypothetical protein